MGWFGLFVLQMCGNSFLIHGRGSSSDWSWIACVQVLCKLPQSTALELPLPSTTPLPCPHPGTHQLSRNGTQHTQKNTVTGSRTPAAASWSCLPASTQERDRGSLFPP